MASISQRVRAGMEVVIERDTQPVAAVRAVAPMRHTISECISGEDACGRDRPSPTLDPDFAADVEKIIRNRKP